MANWYADKVNGDDANGGTSWGDAKETLRFDTGLYGLPSATDHLYIRGYGESNPYSPYSEPPLDCNWHGVKTKGGIQGMPLIIGTGTRLKMGTRQAYYVHDIWFRNMNEGADDKRAGFGDSRDIIERCVFEDCTFGIGDCRDEDGMAIRYCLLFDNNRDIRYPALTTDRNWVFHHNSCYNGSGIAAVYVKLGVGFTAGFAEFHSNIFMNTAVALLIEADGTMNFAGGEPDYNVWHGNTTDIDDGGHGVSKGTNQLSVDPQFLKVASGDFRLAPGSPALYSDAASKDRGPLGPGPTMARRMRLGRFFAAPGKLIEANSSWRDDHLGGGF